MEQTQMRHGLFDAKLSELGRSFSDLKNKIQFYQHCDREQIHAAEEAQRLACLAEEASLSQRVSSSRNGTLAAIFQAQLGYMQQLKSIYLQQIQPCKPQASRDEQEQAYYADQLALCAECCIDQADYAAKLAVFAALAAMEQQMALREAPAQAAPQPAETGASACTDFPDNK